MRLKLFPLMATCLSKITSGCSTSTSNIQKTLEENPSILFGVIEQYPKEFMEVITKVADKASRLAAEEHKKKVEKFMEEDFKNPKKPVLSDQRVIDGDKEAPIAIVSYSGFECSYCAEGAKTIKQIKEEYGDKVSIIFKHVPTSEKAARAARYFESIRKQSVSRAKKYHELLFANQEKFFNDSAYIEEAAQQSGADISKIAKIKDSVEITRILDEDAEEANKLGISASPGYIINGVRVIGAYPIEHFKEIIDRHLAKIGSSADADGIVPCNREPFGVTQRTFAGDRSGSNRTTIDNFN